MHITRTELARYDRDGLTLKAVDRVFELAELNPWSESGTHGNLSYRDYLIFMLSEEDKVSRQGVRFWFNVLDLDGDGEISAWEIKQFYVDQAERMEELGVECMAFEDTLCQLLDLAQTDLPLTLKSLRACGQADLFVNTLLNINK